MTLSSPPPAFAQRWARAHRLESPALREQLAELARRFRGEHDEYERASQSWTPEAGEKKREARKAREGTLREIGALLASGGHGELAEEIERLPFTHKLVALDALVQEPAAVEELAEQPVTEGPAVSTQAEESRGVVVEAPTAPETPIAMSASNPSSVSTSTSPPTPTATSTATPTPISTPRSGGRSRSMGLGARVAAGLVALVVAAVAWHFAHPSRAASAEVAPAAEPPAPPSPPEPRAADSAASLEAKETLPETPPSASPAKHATPSPARPPRRPSRTPGSKTPARAQDPNANPY